MGGYYYSTAQGDMWDYIAWKVYGDESYMQTMLAAEENREIIDIYIFSAHDQVWCPYVEEANAEEEEAPEWRGEGDGD